MRPVVAAALACLAGVALAQPAAQPDEAPLRLRATPMLAEKLPPGQPSAIFVSGDEITGRADLETTVQGHAELRRPGLAVWGDTLGFDQGTDVATAIGHVRVNSKGDRYTAREGQLQVDADRKSVV